MFSYYSDDLFSFCVKCVIGAYKANGEIDKAQVTLDEAKSLMKEMSEKYSDYEHYPNLLPSLNGTRKPSSISAFIESLQVDSGIPISCSSALGDKANS